MAVDYSVNLCRMLRERFRQCGLERPFRTERYDSGERLDYEVTPVDTLEGSCRVRLEVEKFVGGGFAGQVYMVKVLEAGGRLAEKLQAGESFALKILIPPSRAAELFRNLLYFVGFQGAFQPQTNPTAARAGAIWQKFIRRAAAIRFGDDCSVNDVHATFVDPELGSCGEISDWVDGRIWRLEVDDRADLLRRWLRGKPVDRSQLGSPEYRAKREFMTAFVRLLNDIGAHEFARQYEWSTCKSQPNCLKRISTEDDPAAGLTAVDFRAGLALLPFLPMSPGDFILILKGLARGSLVQFDRGDLDKLAAFAGEHPREFFEMRGLLAELERCEEIYRASLIDVTHNHLRLMYSRRLWRRILRSAVGGWRVRGLLDDKHARALDGRVMPVALFALLGIIPILGPFLRRAWGRADYRAHYRSMLTAPGYFRRALAGKMIERAISWHRDGRITESKAERVACSLPSFLVHRMAALFPVGIHKILTDGAHLRERLWGVAIRPVRLYFNEALRREWLQEMVRDGRNKRLVSDEDAEVILSRIDEPFIQKYLKALAVHVCTAPVTQVVSLIVAGIYILTHPDLSPAQAWAIGLGILALFQVVPISPGSMARGIYVLYLVIRERNFRDYNIAVFLGFFKYVGYLAFPIQMTYRYPTLARFMAAHWATDAVHIVPVFGESGALLEHKVFTLFYNTPLTLRGRMRRRAELRSTLAPRWWQLLPLALAAGGVIGATEYLQGWHSGSTPALRDIWWCLLAAPLMCGSLYTLLAGGTPLGWRIAGAALCGMAAGAVYSAISYGMLQADLMPGHVAAGTLWRVFISAVLAPLGAIVTEVWLPEP